MQGRSRHFLTRKTELVQATGKSNEKNKKKMMSNSIALTTIYLRDSAKKLLSRGGSIHRDLAAVTNSVIINVLAGR